MLKLTKKIVTFIIIATLLVSPQVMIKVLAYDFSISAQSTTINVGESTTVSISVSGMTGRFNVTGAVNDSFWSDGDAYKTYSVTGRSSGSLTVNVSSAATSDGSGNIIGDSSQSVIVNVINKETPPTTPETPNTPNTPETPNKPNTPNTPNTPENQTPETSDEDKSKDASLASLSVSAGTLSPEFSADVTNYTVQAEKDATSITIEASANDAKAKVSGTGEKSLEAGENEFRVDVTAEDGTLRSYVIVVNVDEAPTNITTLNDQKLGVVKDTSMVVVPTGFEESTVSLNDQEIIAWKNPLSNLTIVYLENEKGERNFYLYDEKTMNITSIYIPMALLGRNVAVIDVPAELQEKEGMAFTEVEVDTVKMPGWIFDDKALENYVVVYLMDEAGETHYYQYEKTENTLQLYSQSAPLTQASFEAMLKEKDSALQQRLWMMIALAVTNILTVILLLILVLKKKNRKDSRPRRTIRKDTESEPLNYFTPESLNVERDERNNEERMEDEMNMNEKNIDDTMNINMGIHLQSFDDDNDL